MSSYALHHACARVGAGRQDQGVHVPVAARALVPATAAVCAAVCAHAGLEVVTVTCASRTDAAVLAAHGAGLLGVAVNPADVQGSLRDADGCAPCALVLAGADLLSDRALGFVLALSKHASMRELPVLVVAVSVARRGFLARCYGLDQDSCMMWSGQDPAALAAA